MKTFQSTAIKISMHHTLHFDKSLLDYGDEKIRFERNPRELIKKFFSAPPIKDVESNFYASH